MHAVLVSLLSRGKSIKYICEAVMLLSICMLQLITNSIVILRLKMF